MNKPFLTPDNVMQHKYQVMSSDWAYDSCLKLHMEINDYLGHLIDSTKYDTGREYANWLNSLGFQNQSDEGWWNQTAVDINNMELFAEYWKWDPDEDEAPNQVMLAIRERIENFRRFKLQKGARVDMLSHHCKVIDYL